MNATCIHETPIWRLKASETQSKINLGTVPNAEPPCCCISYKVVHGEVEGHGIISNCSYCRGNLRIVHMVEGKCSGVSNLNRMMGDFHSVGWAVLTRAHDFMKNAEYQEIFFEFSTPLGMEILREACLEVAKFLQNGGTQIKGWFLMINFLCSNNLDLLLVLCVSSHWSILMHCMCLLFILFQMWTQNHKQLSYSFFLQGLLTIHRTFLKIPCQTSTLNNILVTFPYLQSNNMISCHFGNYLLWIVLIAWALIRSAPQWGPRFHSLKVISAHFVLLLQQHTLTCKIHSRGLCTILCELLQVKQVCLTEIQGEASKIFLSQTGLLAVCYIFLSQYSLNQTNVAPGQLEMLFLARPCMETAGICPNVAAEYWYIVTVSCSFSWEKKWGTGSCCCRMWRRGGHLPMFPRMCSWAEPASRSGLWPSSSMPWSCELLVGCTCKVRQRKLSVETLGQVSKCNPKGLDDSQGEGFNELDGLFQSFVFSHCFYRLFQLAASLRSVWIAWANASPAPQGLSGESVSLLYSFYARVRWVMGECAGHYVSRLCPSPRTKKKKKKNRLNPTKTTFLTGTKRPFAISLKDYHHLHLYQTLPKKQKKRADITTSTKYTLDTQPRRNYHPLPSSHKQTESFRHSVSRDSPAPNRISFLLN
ncbi:hypothetical protein VP01_137g2 [Puccinia sorghi]|uniref:Uncharacterized protein n=1 Tax=Puccinia sorghi TaxID=27349 RepID=A0A0L6VNB3_9BASI|nr:hypothetical protein VP01_137g2 [Puccinia sorghi]